jgi:hypothetical protein
VLLLTDDPDWAGTDLHDFGDWEDAFKRGFPLTEDARAMLDFYVYQRLPGDGRELVCNVQAEFDGAGLLALHADNEMNHWRRPGGAE